MRLDTSMTIRDGRQQEAKKKISGGNFNLSPNAQVQIMEERTFSILVQ
jgi:5-carboxymethyl-2-hydroxymuconate isomerase